MSKRTRKSFILAKTETEYGTDSTPDGSNLVYTTDLPSWTPYGGETQQRSRRRDHLGAFAEINVGPNGEVQFTVPLAGSGTPGTPPVFGPLLRACGLSETITPDESVVYQPISDEPESAVVYAFLDGYKQVLAGSRGTVVVNWNAGEMPSLQFTMTALYKRPVSATSPELTGVTMADEIAVNVTNTVASVHGFAACINAVSLDVGNSINYRNQINCEKVDLSNRESTGSITVDAPPLAEKDYFAAIESHAGVTLDAVTLTHGSAAGNIVEFAAPKTQLSNISVSDSDGIAQLELSSRYLPDAGDDEFTLTFK